MAKKIILFLDIDGVLNACGNPEWDPTDERTEERYRGFIGICPKRVALLNEVIERTGAVIVLSSTWRLMDTLENTLAYMRQQGFKGEMIDKTPAGSRLSGRGFRGDEVNEWLEDNAAKHGEIHHAIVDDDGDFHKDQPLIQTRTGKGLTREHVEALVQALTPQPIPVEIP